MGETQDSRKEMSGVIRKMPGKKKETEYGGFVEQNMEPPAGGEGEAYKPDRSIRRNAVGEPAQRKGKSLAVNRVYKSRIFTMIFQDKEKLLELYNAISGKNYTDPELLEINTLENAIYMNMQNDLSFLIDARLSLYEHQSTLNPNLPLRFSDLYHTRPEEGSGDREDMEKGLVPSTLNILTFHWPAFPIAQL